MSENKQRKDTFFGGAAILAAGIIVVKVISAVYKMPLVNILGSSGYADFTAAFNIFNILLTVSTAGIPVAMSKMISEANASHRHKQTHKIFRVSLFFFGAVGIFCSLVMFFGANFFAGIMNDTKAAECMRVLAPSVALVSGLSVFRGYAQGYSNMTPSSVSQIIEALFKLIVGLTLAWYFIRVLGKPDYIGAAGAIAGVTVSELAALLYMAWDYLRTQRHTPSPAPSERPDSAKRILVLGRLQNAGLLLSEDAARSLMGNYTGVQTVYQIPAALMVAITASVIPAVTICFTQKDRTGAAKIVGSSLKTAALLAFPSGIGMLVLGKPIVQLLFPSLDADIAGTILSILGIANIFVCLMLVATSVLQAYNILSLPIFTMLAGGVVMVLFDYFMVGMVQFNIYGSPVGTCLCFGLTCGLDLHLVRRVVPGCPNYAQLFGKTLAASIIMGAAAWAVYGLTSHLIGVKLAVLLAILLAVVLYAVLLVLLQVLTKDDLSLMPKGDKIAKLLHIN